MLVDLSLPLCAVGPCSFSVNSMEFGSKFEHCDCLDGEQEEHFRFDLTHTHSGKYLCFCTGSRLACL